LRSSPVMVGVLSQYLIYQLHSRASPFFGWSRRAQSTHLVLAQTRNWDKSEMRP
jgi:hypothetical protein